MFASACKEMNLYCPGLGLSLNAMFVFRVELHSFSSGFLFQGLSSRDLPSHLKQYFASLLCSFSKKSTNLTTKSWFRYIRAEGVLQQVEIRRQKTWASIFFANLNCLFNILILFHQGLANSTLLHLLNYCSKWRNGLGT